MTNPKPNLIAQQIDGYDPEIGAALWRLQDTRRRTLRSLRGIPPDFLNLEVAGNSIGTILYHVALIEADWLYTEVLELPVSEEVQTLLPVEGRDSAGHLSELEGDPMETHLSRLSFIREQLMVAFLTMTLEDFHRPRHLPDYDVSPAWVLHHLTQHEAEHRGELESVAAQLRALKGGDVRVVD